MLVVGMTGCGFSDGVKDGMKDAQKQESINDSDTWAWALPSAATVAARPGRGSGSWSVSDVVSWVRAASDVGSLFLVIPAHVGTLHAANHRALRFRLEPALALTCVTAPLTLPWAVMLRARTL